MRQLLVPRRLSGDCAVEITGEDYHYLARVRRVRAGDRVSLIDSDGVAFIAVVAQVVKGTAVRLYLGRATSASTSPAAGNALPRIALLQAIAKRPAMDRVVRQATELGVATIVPFIASRSAAAEGAGPGRLARWQRIVRAAVQQSGAIPPTIEAPQSFSELLRNWVDGSVGIVCATDATSPVIATPAPAPTVAEVRVVVGPEGDLDSVELRELTARGFVAVSLGSHVLRVDTAVAAALSAMWQWLAVAAARN